MVRHRRKKFESFDTCGNFLGQNSYVDDCGSMNTSEDNFDFRIIALQPSTA